MATIAPLSPRKRPNAGWASGRVVALRKDGSELPVEIALSPIHGDTGLSVLVIDSGYQRTQARASASRPSSATSWRTCREWCSGRVVRFVAHELNPAVDRDPEQCAGGDPLPGAFAAHLDEVRDSLTNIVENDKRAG
jgi:hypothetical protein